VATIIQRPAADEYPALFERYVGRVPEGDVVDTLRRQFGETAALLAGLSDEQAGFRYAPGKWSIKQVAGHMADTERIFLYRALCFARGEAAPLPGFDEDAYVAAADFHDRRLAGLVNELRATREGTLAFFENVAPSALDRRGLANNREYSVRAVASLIAGHERHHVAILRERYLAAG
jgi:uncharacterized damage-inducible protein DinB